MRIESAEQDFSAFFARATGFARPYDWQIRVAVDGLPQILPVPTGLGKTEGVVLAWAWRRLRAQYDEPVHLVYCLPMRSLVRQTVERIGRCFEALAIDGGVPPVSVHRLMGGAIDEEWAQYPDRPWVLVGTQDQLLSRALNRGYAMDRFMWPVHFGLLNQDCQWVIDEVQLMGPGLWTTAQLDWMRQKRFRGLKPCRTTWMSATIGTGFLATTDRTKDGLDTFQRFDPFVENDQNCGLRSRHAAWRPLDWFVPLKGKDAPALPEQIASRAQDEHCRGTLTLIVCNTVKMAQSVFRSLREEGPPRILITSRFRPIDRQGTEQQLIAFEARRRQSTNGRIENDPGLICVSTQVVEAGVDISAHRLWSEIAPWPSVIQRLGRLNRDGRDHDAKAYFWREQPIEQRKRDGDVWIGPYREKEIGDAMTLIKAAKGPSASGPFEKALEIVKKQHGTLLEQALQPRLEPYPRALDVHGLFSTERDLHGGFTDVSRFVRGLDPDADITLFWRDWPGATPPEGSELVGPPFDPATEGCPVAVYRLQEALKATRATAWIWNDEAARWDACPRGDLRPGMVVMLRGDAGGYHRTLGWTGQRGDRLQGLQPPGPGRALRDDERVEIGYWSSLDVHLKDARSQAVAICEVVLSKKDEEEDEKLETIRTAVIGAAGLHDLGKTHPDWQKRLPAQASKIIGPLAKSPPVLRIHTHADGAEIETAVRKLRPNAERLTSAADTKSGNVILRWAICRRLNREERDQLRGFRGVRRVENEPFRPGMRHEAATALAMWHRYRRGRATYPALAVYLAAAHHGKVRTVLRTLSTDGSDVFGVSREPAELEFAGRRWPLDFSIAADGADGEWSGSGFVLKDHGWTGLVADLLGPWRDAEGADIGTVSQDEPRRLGPFALAWLEALVRVSDWRASDNPSQSVEPRAK